MLLRGFAGNGKVSLTVLRVDVDYAKLTLYMERFSIFSLSRHWFIVLFGFL